MEVRLCLLYATDFFVRLEMKFSFFLVVWTCFFVELGCLQVLWFSLKFCSLESTQALRCFRLRRRITSVLLSSLTFFPLIRHHTLTSVLETWILPPLDLNSHWTPNMLQHDNIGIIANKKLLEPITKYFNWDAGVSLLLLYRTITCSRTLPGPNYPSPYFLYIFVMHITSEKWYLNHL